MDTEQNISNSRKKDKIDASMTSHTKPLKKKILLLCLQIILYLLPIILLVSLEVTLRLIKIGEDRSPLIKKQIHNLSFYLPNRSFYQQFFDMPLHNFVNWDHLDFYVPSQKDKNTFRIFIFGESAMYGLESSARQLEVMLRQSIPQMKWEIYNVSCPGINSHVLYFLAKACAKLSPDFFIIYMGNNETIGPYGEHSLIYKYPSLRKNIFIRLHTYLKSLRTVQLLERNKLKHEKVEKPIDLTPYIPRQGQEAKTISLYEHNLRDMIKVGINNNAHVIVGTISYNRKFGRKQEEWSSIQLEQTEMNKCITRVCKGFSRNVTLVDIDTMLAKSSDDGIPGYQFFCDNIHFTFQGNYLLASEWYKAIITELKYRNIVTLEGIKPSITIEDCALYLGWNKATELWQIQLQKAVITA